MVTFHQSYSYEEFVEGIRPDLDSETGKLSYKVQPGVFKQIATIAKNDPDNNYLLVIDEINRGNIAKVFGELITLIEGDKRETMSAVLPYSQEEFTVPRNLFILGTMNTADRSIALLDIALRRRFEFKELMPDYSLLDKQVDDLHLGDLLRSINEKIAVLIDQDHQIGHSYFMRVKTKQDLHNIWHKKILPLLQEYFYNDWSRLQQLLGKTFISEKQVEFSLEADLDDPILYSFRQFDPEELVRKLRNLIDNEKITNTNAL